MTLVPGLAGGGLRRIVGAWSALQMSGLSDCLTDGGCRSADGGGGGVPGPVHGLLA